MIGYGSAPWMLAIQERAELDAACPPIPEDTGDTAVIDTAEPVDTDTGTPKTRDTCGCSTGASFGWVGVLAVLGVRRR